jgi:hypothetical protein
MALQTAQMTINLHENDSCYASQELSRQLQPVEFFCAVKLHFPKHHHYRPNINLTMVIIIKDFNKNKAYIFKCV